MKPLKAIHLLVCCLLLSGAALAQFSAGLSAASVLAKPVEVADVKIAASFTNNMGKIEWNATTQLQVRRYELEKSTDGENYYYLTALAGTQQQYHITDNNVAAGTSYYRLKIIGENNSITYSHIGLMDTRAGNTEIKLLDTRIANSIYVWVPVHTTIRSASIITADGKMQLQAPVNNSTNLAQININGLATGLYQLCLQTSKGQTVKLKFSKPA